jgi:hypothetical protein
MAVLTIGSVIADTEREYRLISLIYPTIVSKDKFIQDVKEGLQAFPGFEPRPESITLTVCDVTRGGFAYVVAGYQDRGGKYETKVFYSQDKTVLSVDPRSILLSQAVTATRRRTTLRATKYQFLTLTIP